MCSLKSLKLAKVLFCGGHNHRMYSSSFKNIWIITFNKYEYEQNALTAPAWTFDVGWRTNWISANLNTK